MSSKQHPIYCKYQIHSDGKIWSPFKGGYFMALTPKRSGYVSVTIRVEKGVYKTRYAHRLVWEAFNGPIPSDVEINHKNGLKHDNSLDNLELVTKSENIKHAISELGHRPVDNLKIDHELSRLRREAALLLKSSGWNQYDIASVLGVSQPSVSKLVSAEYTNPI